MKNSVRNALKGTILENKEDHVMAAVMLDVNGQPIVSVITKDTVQELGLRKSGTATAIIKSTEVMLGVD